MSNPFHDDPRLTAYALGELDGNERREVERLLAESPAARDVVDEIRAIAAELTAHLRTEPMPALTSLQRSAVMSGPKSEVGGQRSEVGGQRPARTPITRSGNAAVVAAACLMLLAAGWLMAVSEKGDTGTARKEQRVSSTSVDGIPPIDLGLDERLAKEVREKAFVESLPRDPKSQASARRRHGSPQPVTGTFETPSGKAPGNFFEAPPTRELRDLHRRSGSIAGYLGQPLSTINSPHPANPALVQQRVHWGSTTLGVPIGKAGQPHLPVLGYISDGRQNRTLYRFESLDGRAGARNVFYKQMDGRRLHDGTSNGLGAVQMRTLRERLVLSAELRAVNEAERLLREMNDGNAKKKDGFAAGSKKTGKGRFPTDDLKNGDPASKSGSKSGSKSKKKPATEPTIEWFAAKHVKAVREQVAKQLDGLAKQHPKRELAILRVKTRLSSRLEGLEQQVALAERGGQRIAAVEGRVILGEAVRAEVRNLDVDGDGRADFGNEGFDAIVENTFLTPLANPLSTFSIDVDTASYSNTRRYIDAGALPPRNAVRVEEFVNYFHYDYPQPATSSHPFSVTLEAGVCPWNVKHRLVLIGLKGREIPHDKRPPANLVFLIDVSGSMQPANRLPLVKLGLEMLVDQLRAKDRVSIVTYSDQARTVLEPTAGDKRDELLRAIHSLNAAGSTNGSAGIQMAYDQAQKAFAKTGSNRVILCTDGDFNVGVSSDDALVTLIQEKAKSKVFLSVFGFGMGNTKHAKLEKIANKGNGHYAYIDKFQEAKKVFVEEMSGTLYTIAKDVKIQVEFNPAKVASYRLIGYENRLLAAQDFNDDKKDAGEIGAGHTVTALYEIVPVDAKSAKPSVDDLKYQKRVVADKAKPVTQELLTVKLRYKQPTGDKSTKIEFPLKEAAAKKAPTENFDFASAVAMYGLLLRDSKYAGEASLELVRELAAGAMGKDPEGRRSEFVKLVHKTESYVAGKLGKAVPAARPIKRTR